MTEEQLEQAALAWPQDLGYTLPGTMLPRLISGQLCLPEAMAALEATP